GNKIVTGKSDVCLLLPGSKPNKKARINVLRLDGLIIDKNIDFKTKNEKIKNLAKLCDAFVFQNEFCKVAYRNFLDFSPKQHTCILNGASSDEFLPRYRKDYFLANS